MRSYTVHHPQEDFRTIAKMADAAVLVADGFSWGAFSVPPVWLCLRGLWLELTAYVLAVVAVIALSGFAILDLVAVLCVFVALNFLVGLEGNEFLRAKLGRAGFHTMTVVRAESLEAAERRFFENLFERAGDPPLRVETGPRAASPERPLGTVWAEQGRTGEDEIVGMFPRPESKA